MKGVKGRDLEIAAMRRAAHVNGIRISGAVWFSRALDGMQYWRHLNTRVLPVLRFTSTATTSSAKWQRGTRGQLEWIR